MGNLNANPNAIERTPNTRTHNEVKVKRTYSDCRCGMEYDPEYDVNSMIQSTRLSSETFSYRKGQTEQCKQVLEV